MTAKELFQAGKLDEAVQALGAELRDNPTDVRRRTFLFELLCFSGDYDRAEKQLNILADSNQETQMGAVLYHSALHAERLRQDLFRKREFPSSESTAEPQPRTGTVNGTPFTSFEDADPRIGARLELFAAGAYLWIPFEHITFIETGPPTRLRDLLWTPALVRTGPSFRGTELGEVLLPAISPFSWQHADGNVRLGRSTVWAEDESGEAVPFGQKLFLADGEEVPLLEMRKVEFATDEPAAAASEASP
ncbi:MAG: type VI secretion system accessory protein TagJ [Bryobacteraceae bacterium]